MRDALDEFQRRVIRLAKFQKELDALAAMPDSEIDCSDIPETLDWTGAKRGLFNRRRADSPQPQPAKPPAKGR